MKSCGINATNKDSSTVKDVAASSEQTRLLAVKTCYQVDSAHDDRIAIAADAVVVHQHGRNIQVTLKAIASWQSRGFAAGRMFFADSDAKEVYSRGQWDGVEHLGDREASSAGVVWCEDRPYMLPTDGWTRYLEELSRQSVRGGAEFIWAEEPLAHLATGYEPTFRAIWEKRFGQPLLDPHEDAESTYRTGQLKTELYTQMIGRLAAASKQEADTQSRSLPFLLPVHSLYSNMATGLVAPLGSSRDIRGVDGYVGQIWTGPVRWALDHYDGPYKSFFGSACVLYDYFNEIAVGSGRTLYLLVDPVEDDPHHSWEQFRVWYVHCTVAMLLVRDVDSYEIMPWPERIFLPGHTTGGGTPAPESFRQTILNLCQVFQEIPVGGQWLDFHGDPMADPPKVGIAVADNSMWHEDHRRQINRTFGLLMPLVLSGVPASSCVLERAGDDGYLDRFKVIVLSYQCCKPPSADTHEAIAAWVRRGGVLVALGRTDQMDSADLWWRCQGHPSALHHLMGQLKIDGTQEGDHAVSQGHVLRRLTDPADLAVGQAVTTQYLPMMDLALRTAGSDKGLCPQDGLRMRRGPFIIAHALKASVEISGPVVDLLDESLPILPKAVLSPNQSGLYKSLPPSKKGPQVAHATHRLIAPDDSDTSLQFSIRGPAGTPAVVRIMAGAGEGSVPVSSLVVTAQTGDRKSVPVVVTLEGQTLRLNFENVPAGIRVTVW